MNSFLVRHHRRIVTGFYACLALIACIHICGCSGTFLGEAETVINIAEAAVTSLMGVLSIWPAAAGVVAILQEALTALGALLTAVGEYKVAQNATTEQKVTEAFTVVESALQPLLQPLGVTGAWVKTVTTVVSVVLGQVQAWFALLKKAAPAVADAPTPEVALAHAVRVHAETEPASKPMNATQFRDEINNAMHATTGDEETDAAFAKASV